MPKRIKQYACVGWLTEDVKQTKEGRRHVENNGADLFLE